MFKLNDSEILIIGLVLEGFFYGLYSGVFAMYLKIQVSKRDSSNKMQNLIFYSICVLYILSVAIFVCDIMVPTYQFLRKPTDSLLRLSFIQLTSFGCCDFIAQCILIYRCWIVWGCKIRVVIVPSILAFAFLVIWLVGGSSTRISLGQLATPGWGLSMILPSLVMTLTVNALVTGLIVFRICKVFQENKAAKVTSNDHILGPTRRSPELRLVIFVLIESGMALFSIQLARLVVTILGTDAAITSLGIIGSIHDMLNGIIPTIILVRTSMGLSFHDEKSMEEGSLHFASNLPNSVPEMGSINITGRDSRDDDEIDVRGGNDIDIIER